MMGDISFNETCFWVNMEMDTILNRERLWKSDLEEFFWLFLDVRAYQKPEFLPGAASVS